MRLGIVLVRLVGVAAMLGLWQWEAAWGFGAADSGVVSRISLGPEGEEGNGSSYHPSTSGDGRYVVFNTSATNLVNGDDTNGSFADVLVHDRTSGATTRVSVRSDGTQRPAEASASRSAISHDGRFVVFQQGQDYIPGDSNGKFDIFLHDRETGETRLLSVNSDHVPANDDSQVASISGNGRFVVFTSAASNLVLSDTNRAGDIFVYDQQTEQTTRVSVASDGTGGNRTTYYAAISADGRFVAFESGATNLVPNDRNEKHDMFVHDRATGETTRISLALDGTEANDESAAPAISADGRYVAFVSRATNLVAGDTNHHCSGQNCSDVFVHDRLTGQTELVSVTSDGTQSNGRSGYPSISADGRFVSFPSYASNFVPGDTNGMDIFVHDRLTGTTERASSGINGTVADGESFWATISADGRSVVFSSDASNLVSDDTNGRTDVFVYDRDTTAHYLIYFPTVRR